MVVLAKALAVLMVEVLAAPMGLVAQELNLMAV